MWLLLSPELPLVEIVVALVLVLLLAGLLGAVGLLSVEDPTIVAPNVTMVDHIIHGDNTFAGVVAKFPSKNISTFSSFKPSLLAIEVATFQMEMGPLQFYFSMSGKYRLVYS